MRREWGSLGICRGCFLQKAPPAPPKNLMGRGYTDKLFKSPAPRCGAGHSFFSHGQTERYCGEQPGTAKSPSAPRLVGANMMETLLCGYCQKRGIWLPPSAEVAKRWHGEAVTEGEIAAQTNLICHSVMQLRNDGSYSSNFPKPLDFFLGV